MDRGRWLLRWFYFWLGFVTTFPSMALRVELQTRFGLSIAHIGAVCAAMVVPWSMRGLFALGMDKVALCGGRRRPYIVAANLLAAVFAFAMMAPGLSMGGFAALFTVVQLGSCVADVAYDACMVEETAREHPERRGAVQTSTTMNRAVGRAAGLCGNLAYYAWGGQATFGMLGTVFLAQALAGAMIREAPPDEAHASAWTWREFLARAAEGLSDPVIVRILAINSLAGALPSAGLALFFFLLDEIGVTPLQFGVLGAVGEFARVASSCATMALIRRVQARAIFMHASMLDLFVSYAPIVLVTGLYRRWGLHPIWFAATDDVFGEVFDEARATPLLNLVAILSKPGVEAVVYSTNRTAQNISAMLGSLISAHVARALGVTHNRFERLPELVTICAAVQVVTPLLTFLLPAGTVAEVARGRAT